jgi:hypothetical protein
METDGRLKVLFRKYAPDLLTLTHDEAASVLSVEAVELQDIKRSVDCLMKLQQADEVYSATSSSSPTPTPIWPSGASGTTPSSFSRPGPRS